MNLLDYIVTQIKTALAVRFQYRVAVLVFIAGWMIEPVVNLVLWTTVARGRGGMVGGFTPDDFVAYYLISVIVRHVNQTWVPGVWENRIRQGMVSPWLLQPVHLFTRDLASLLGIKVVGTMIWLPLAALLLVTFQPVLHPSPWQVFGFVVALVVGFSMTMVIQWVMGLAAFWITRVSAIFELYATAQWILSGRLVPLSLMPEWTQQIANLLPFRWAFGFQIELLMGRLTLEQMLIGFGAQAVWLGIGLLCMRLVLPAALRQYSAVGA